MWLNSHSQRNLTLEQETETHQQLFGAETIIFGLFVQHLAQLAPSPWPGLLGATVTQINITNIEFGLAPESRYISMCRIAPWSVSALIFSVNKDYNITPRIEQQPGQYRGGGERGGGEEERWLGRMRLEGFFSQNYTAILGINTPPPAAATSWILQLWLTLPLCFLLKRTTVNFKKNK